MTPETDVVLGDRYALTERIAGGGMGEVWVAHDQVLERSVAVKILRREYADDSTFLERFRNEARHAAGLSHSGIAAVYDYGEADGSSYIVMEHVRGEPLSDLIEREGPLTPDRTLDIVGQAAFALQVAHDGGVIHRDVKPGNLLLAPDGTVKITDFGIARATNSVPLTLTGAIMGTAYYISPEQASGGSVTPASDIYSLGIVAFECLSGRRPFDGHTPVSVALAQVREEPPALPPGVPAPVAALVMRMLAKEPSERPASAGELGAEAIALRNAMPAAPPTRALPVPDGDPTRRLSPGATIPVSRRHDTDPGFFLPPERHRPRWLPPALGLAVAAILLLAVVRACDSPGVGDGGTGSQTRSATSDSSTSAPAKAGAIDVDPADYVGRPVGDVRSRLAALGLRTTVTQSAGGGVVGTVKGLAPSGTLSVGDTVRLRVVAATPPEDQKDPGDEGKGKKKKDD